MNRWYRKAMLVIAGLLLGILFGGWDGWWQGVIIALLIEVFLGQLDANSDIDGVKKLVNSQEDRLKNLSETISQLEPIIDQLDYRIRIIKLYEDLDKINDYNYLHETILKQLKKLHDLSLGKDTYTTNLSSPDRFYKLGVCHTKKSLKATVCADWSLSGTNFWKFHDDYLEKQKELLKRNPSMEIIRVFIFSERTSEINARMKKESYNGIKVYYIKKEEHLRSNNPHIEDAWLDEDYVIQDDNLLVCSYPDRNNSDFRDEVTINKGEVRKKLNNFNELCKYAAEY